MTLFVPVIERYLLGLFMDTQDLETYQVQLTQVEAALQADPDNQELASSVPS